MPPRRAASPPYVVAPLPRCSIVLDRHTHKNGGSTVRSIVNDNDLHDGWAYWGYGLHQHRIITQRLMSNLLGDSGSKKQLRRGNSNNAAAAGAANNRSCAAWASRAPLRLVAEHHYSRHSMEAVLGTFGPYSPLQRAAARCRCRVVLVTRLREPLSFYTSFYRWTVNWRQQRNATAFGATMIEWAPRNLQATLLLNPLDATWAEYVGVHSDEGNVRRTIYSQFDEHTPSGSPLPPAAVGSNPIGAGPKRRAELQRVLASFDLVGLVERFDETMLMLSDLAGLQRLLYTRIAPGTTNPHYKQPSAAQVCPDMAACRARLRQIAPVDYEIYDTAVAAFETKVTAMGKPFQRRLAHYREALRQHARVIAARDAAAEKANREALPVVQRFVAAPTEMHWKVPMHLLHCGLGDGALGLETCQRVYADTPFRFNWRPLSAHCCLRLKQCLQARVARRRIPRNCMRYLPRGAGMDETPSAAELLRLNATADELCRRECTKPPPFERSLMLRHRVPTRSEVAALPLPALFSRRDAWNARGSVTTCADTPRSAMSGKPWLDFVSCAEEGRTRENLLSHFGPCAGHLWMRFNCRKTCGLCGLSLRETAALKPRLALAAARTAAKARGVPMPKK